MNKKILVAQLGIGNIRNAEYAYFTTAEQRGSSDLVDNYIKNNKCSECGVGDTRCEEKNENCYPFLAYLDTEKEEKFTDLLLIGTMMSSWDILLETLFPEEAVSKEDKECDKTAYNKRIRKLLEEKLSDRYGLNAVTVIVKNGITETEIMGNFNEIKQHVEEVIKLPSDKMEADRIPDRRDISIYLDISNAFRSVPMLVFAATNYLSVRYHNINFVTEVCCSVLESSLEPVPVDDTDHVQKYRIYERKTFGKSKNTNVNGIPQKQAETVIPTVDLTIVSMINQWAMAINEFYDSGSVVKLKQLIEDGDDSWFTDGSKSDVTNAFEKFSFAVNSNNLKLFESAVKTIMELQPTEIMPGYISDFVDYLVQDFRERFRMVCGSREGDGNCYGSLTLAIAKWYADQSRFGDAVVALQEGAVTYVMENYCEDVKELLKKRMGMGEKEADDLTVDQLRGNDAYRTMISTLLFSNDENDDFLEYCKQYNVDERISAWVEYLEKYDYICKRLRDPAMKINYVSSDVFGEMDLVAGSDNDEYDMRQAEENIHYCIEKMIGNDLADHIKRKFEYLKQVKVHDFFISYRRHYGEKDGRERAVALRDELMRHGYDVWMDEKLEVETGEFKPIIREAIRNSRYFIVLLGDQVFNMSLYQERLEEEEGKDQSQTLSVFYEEIITAYKHFKQDSNQRIIMVSFDGYKTKPDKTDVVLFRDKSKIISAHPEAKKYYDILAKIVNGELQFHFEESGIPHLVEDDILNIRGIEENIPGIRR